MLEENQVQKSELILGVVLGGAHLLGVTALVFYLILAIVTGGTISEGSAEFFSSFLGSLGIIGVFYIIYKKHFIKEFLNFKKPATYLYILVFFVLSYFFLIICSAFLTALFPDVIATNQNESSLEEMREGFGFFFYLFVIILAPVAEEFIFRYSTFKLVKRKSRLLAYIIVISIFALLHLISSINVLAPDEVVTQYLVMLGGNVYIPLGALLTLPAYLIPATLMTYAMDRTDNLAIPIGIHVLNNLVASLLVILI